MKKIVLNATHNNQKDRQKILRDLAKLEGIKAISFDLEKGTLSVTGEVDPVCIALRLKKCGRGVEIVSVGKPDDKKKEEEKKKEECKKLLCSCSRCIAPPCPPCLGPPCPPYHPIYCEAESSSCTIL